MAAFVKAFRHTMSGGLVICITLRIVLLMMFIMTNGMCHLSKVYHHHKTQAQHHCMIPAAAAAAAADDDDDS